MTVHNREYEIAAKNVIVPPSNTLIAFSVSHSTGKAFVLTLNSNSGSLFATFNIDSYINYGYRIDESYEVRFT